MILSERGTGILLVLAAAFFWSFSGVCVKSMPGVSPLLITGYRSVFTFMVMFGYFVFASGGLDSAGQTARRAMSYRRAWGSALCYALMLVLFISATRYTTAANAILLQYAAPMYVAFLSVPLLGEPVRPKEWLALLGCLLGVLLFFGEQLSTEGQLGNVLGALSGVACAFNAVFMRSLSKVAGKGAFVAAAGKDVSLAFPAVIMGNLLTVMICLPWMLEVSGLTSFHWGILLFLGFIQLGLPYTLFTIGIAKLDAVEVTILAMAEAVLNPLWVAMVNGEIPSTIAFFGGSLIFFSIGIYGRLKQYPQLSEPALN
jgi:drug/metabolite transporter (DMT)-like permease